MTEHVDEPCENPMCKYCGIAARISSLPIPKPKNAPSFTDGYERAIKDVLQILMEY